MFSRYYIIGVILFAVVWAGLYKLSGPYDALNKCLNSPTCPKPQLRENIALNFPEQTPYVEIELLPNPYPEIVDYDFYTPPPVVVKKVKPKPGWILEEGDEDQVTVVAKKLKMKVANLLATDEDHYFEMNEFDTDLYNHLVNTYNVNLDHAYWWTFQIQAYSKKTGIPIPMILTIMSNFSTGFYIDVEKEKQKIKK